MRIGSLFAGIGGLELGLEMAGVGEVSWQVEADEWCRSVLSRHWPLADRSVTDVREASASTLAPVDLICGGFPCQDISVAGRGAGLAGERSGLWGEFARLIRELRPRFVVIENVSALVARGLGAVLCDLAAVGYDAEWTTLRASDVGAPHRRERLFVVAWRVPYSDGLELRDEQGRSESGRSGAGEPGNVGAEDLADTNNDGQSYAATDRGHRDASGRCKSVGHIWPPPPGDLRSWGQMPATSQPSICRTSHGVPRGMDRRRLKALGNAVVPQVAQIAGRRVLEIAAEAA